MTELPELTDKEKVFKEAFASVDAGLLQIEALDAYILRVKQGIEDSNAKLQSILNPTD